MSVSHVYVFLGEVSFHVFSPFLEQITCFFGVEFDTFFVDFGYQPFSKMSFANIFSHSLGYLFMLLPVSFAVQKLFILMKSQKFIFAFVSLALGDVS